MYKNIKILMKYDKIKNTNNNYHQKYPVKFKIQFLILLISAIMERTEILEQQN